MTDTPQTAPSPPNPIAGGTELQPISEQIQQHRVAFLFPSLVLGAYWHPVFKRFSNFCPQTIVYTSEWEDFAPGFENSFRVKLIGEYREVKFEETQGYNKNVSILSFGIVQALLKQRPHVILTSAYSMWSLLALLLKPFCGWKVIILYEGSSQTYDYNDSKWRLTLRRWMGQRSDLLITNSLGGENYLLKSLRLKSSKVFRRPYQVPDPMALTQQDAGFDRPQSVEHQRSEKIRFLFVGQITPRKGIQFLTQACEHLINQGLTQFELTIVGAGEQQAELMEWAQSKGLDNLEWTGRIPYNELGRLFSSHDVFVFPTMEDTWGMVLLEAMIFGLPVLCSMNAGAAESLVMDNWNGYVIQPDNPQDIANKMQHFLENPALVETMGQRSSELMAEYTPDNATQFLLNSVERALQKR